MYALFNDSGLVDIFSTREEAMFAYAIAGMSGGKYYLRTLGKKMLG